MTEGFRDGESGPCQVLGGIRLLRQHSGRVAAMEFGVNVRVIEAGEIRSERQELLGGLKRTGLRQGDSAGEEI
ncbi:hypothetical protein ACFC0S_00075 [Streptomyces sp. NPDC056084]|uniref:hypothetical protein n=1 Tax=unclassified Streptomyces TaxID=2593676 RepID=UPI0035E379B7